MTDPNSDVEMITAPAERRQIARTLTFSRDAIPYINWNAIGEQRSQIGCDIAVTVGADLGLTVLLYWRYDADSFADPSALLLQDWLGLVDAFAHGDTQEFDDMLQNIARVTRSALSKVGAQS